TAASWAPTAGGTVTITAANSFSAGQLVAVTRLTPNGYNGTGTPLSATSTQFTYAPATNPGAATNIPAAFAQPRPIRITDEVGAAQGQPPTIVEIASNPGGPSLVATAGAQFQNNGVPSIDGPFFIGSGLPTSAGQPITVLGTGTGQNWPTSRDAF